MRASGYTDYSANVVSQRRCAIAVGFNTNMYIKSHNMSMVARPATQSVAPRHAQQQQLAATSHSDVVIVASNICTLQCACSVSSPIRPRPFIYRLAYFRNANARHTIGNAHMRYICTPLKLYTCKMRMERGTSVRCIYSNL